MTNKEFWRPYFDPKLKPSVYLAGPMRGRENYNFGTFLEVGILLEILGFQIYNPARADLLSKFKPTEAIESEHNKKHFDLAKAFETDIYQILTREGVVFLPGWTESQGASIEYVVARWTGKKVWAITDWIPGVPASVVLMSLNEVPTHLFPEGLNI